MADAGATLEPDAAALADWFGRLAGRWHLEREASDGARFAGMAVFSPDDEGGLLLEELGELTLAGGRALPARRVWTWHLMLDGAIEIRFPREAGAGLYHRFRPTGKAGGWTGEAEHRCGQDVYRARYRLGGETITIDHDVRAPAKGYRLHACYRRAAGGR